MAWVANRDEVWTTRCSPTPDTVCVSITDPGRRAALPDGFADVLRLQFDDVDERWGAGGDYVMCAKQDAVRIAKFARRHRGKNILVHCAAGVSRSGATVEAILDSFPEYDDRGGASHGWPRVPNPLVTRLLRAALGLAPKQERTPDQRRLSWLVPADVEDTLLR